MAYTTVDDSSAHFQTANYTGNGGTLAVTNDGNSDLQPDLVWLKSRSAATTEHHLMDSTRGEGTGSDDTPNVSVNSNGAEYERDIFSSTGITSDGFSLDGYSDTNTNTETYVAWQWKANGGSRTTNSESGNNPAGGYQANTTAGFSIVDYTGTGAVGTMAHGLGAVPHLIIVKNRDEADSWSIYHYQMSSAPETDYMVIDTTANPADNADRWNDTAPTSTVFTISTAHEVNADGEKYIAYVWTEIQGYSKFGNHIGNSNADGIFIYTGFKPAFVITKLIDTDVHHWILYETGNEGYNKDATTNLYANTTNADIASNDDGGRIDFLSNGFKLRHTSFDGNRNGAKYIYMAFAEQPFVTSGGIPCTAR